MFPTDMDEKILKKREEFYEWYLNKMTWEDWFKVDNMTLKKPKPHTIQKYLKILHSNSKQPLSPAMARYKAFMIVQTALRWPPMMAEIAASIHKTKQKEKMIPVNALRRQRERNRRATETEAQKKARTQKRREKCAQRRAIAKAKAKASKDGDAKKDEDARKDEGAKKVRVGGCGGATRSAAGHNRHAGENPVAV